ncbi:MAG: hypothetical protein PUD55_02450 [Firmicutes bacterium]|nr:hypothetical protein [Bacillota bacterium]
MSLLQDNLIKIFGWTYKYTCRIPEKLRNLIIIGCLFILSFCTYKLTVAPLYMIVDIHAAGMGFYGFFLMIIMAVIAVPGPLEKVKWNKWISIPYFFGAGYMTLMALEHYVGRAYGFYALSLLVVFPTIYLVWANRGDFDRYLTWFCWCNVVLGTGLLLASYMFAPIGETTLLFDRYCSLTWNPNRFAGLMVIYTSALLYLASKRTKLAPLFMLLCGFACHLIWISGCRAGLIIIFVQLVGWAGTILRFDLKKAVAKTLIFVSLSGTLVIAGFLGSINLLTHNTILVADKGCITVFENKFEKFGDQDSDDGYSDEDADPSSGKDRFEKGDKTIDQFTSGRLQIWSFYLKGMNLRGNDMQDFELVLPSGNTFHNAHNTVIEIGYRYGIPAGLAYVLFMIATTIALIKACLTVSKKRSSIGIALFTVAYFVFAMTDVMTLTFERGPVLAFYLVLGGLITGEVLNKDAEQE